MPENVEQFHERVRAATSADGRLQVAVEEMPGWDIFPYELDGLRIKPLQPLALAEPPRNGEDSATCRCAVQADPDPATRVWTGEDFAVDLEDSSGLPILLVLSSVQHFDLADLPAPLAARLGELLVTISAAIEGLPSVARAHIARFGDGGAHLHIFLMGRPLRMLQLRGSPLLDWEENLPRVPLEVLQDNARPIAASLVATYGGQAGALS